MLLAISSRSSGSSGTSVVVVVVVDGFFCGISTRPAVGLTVGLSVVRLVVVACVVVLVGGRVVNRSGRCVVSTVELSVAVEESGQQTPGTKRLLKQSDSRRLLRFKSKAGQALRSSHRPGRPLGVLQ